MASANQGQQVSVRGLRYIRGESTARKHARLETKPSYVEREHADSVTVNSGGGYEHVRSREFVDDDPRDGRIDRYASHHRLLAIAWAIEYHPDADADGRVIDPDYEGVVDMSVLDGIDVHHHAPELSEERGTGWDNREACLVAIEHGRHAGLSTAEERAYAEDAKRVRDGEVSLGDVVCSGCGAEDPGWTFEGSDAEYCVDCATEQADGRTIQQV